MILKSVHRRGREGGPLFLVNWWWVWRQNTDFTPPCPVFFLPLIHSSRSFFTHLSLNCPICARRGRKTQPSPYPQIGWAGPAETTVTCNRLCLCWRKSVRMNTVVVKRAGPEFQYRLCCLLAAWPWAMYLASLCLSFIFYTIKTTYLLGLLRGLTRLLRVKYSEQCLAHSRHLINVSQQNTHTGWGTQWEERWTWVEVAKEGFMEEGYLI